jgi:short-subunit dehydrogenase
VSLGAVEHALITGAAGAIGGALARELHRRRPGLLLSLVDANAAGLNAQTAALGPASRGYRWDLAQPEALPEQLRLLEGERGPVDLLVNCAGIMELRALGSTDWELAARMVRIDLESPLRLMALLVPRMQSQRRGLIVNVSSMAGVTPLRGCAYYGAAKAGLAMASEIAHLELARAGVHVVTVYPGPVRSPLEQRARAQAPDTLLARLLPTGDAGPLAARIADALQHRRSRVVYPDLYRLASRFPRLAGRVTARWSRTPDDLKATARAPDGTRAAETGYGPT